MNNDDIKKILNDLYAVDPSLRSQEKKLITIIRAMAIRPEAHFDPAFSAELRTKLLAELQRERGATAQQLTSASLFGPAFWRYAVVGIAAIAVAVIAFASIQNKSGGTVAFNSSKATITTVGPNAFGTLSSANTPSAAVQTSSQTSAPATSGAMAPAMAVAEPGNASAIAEPMRPIGPIGVVSENYEYTGAPFSQNQSQLNVLKKITGPISSGQATAALEAVGFEGVNLSSFSDLDMSNVTLSQNESFGYQISLDFTDGTMSIDQNYDEWPQGDVTPLTASQIPSDSAVIATANQFLADHSISTGTYGAPQVVQSPIAVPVAMGVAGSAGSSGSADMPMIPYYSDSEEVLYPLVINGQDVYDESGNQIGLTVEVNVRYNRVASVDGLETENYQASAYDAITNTSTILSMAENSDSYPRIYNGANGGVILRNDQQDDAATYDLGTPTMAYEDTYQTDSNGQTNEFLVPAFVFPVMSGGSNSSTQNIVVPLIQDFVQENSTIVPVPMQVSSPGEGATPPAAQ